MLDTMTDPKPADCDDVEITPEMIEAGMEEFYCHPIIADEPTREEVREAILATYKAIAAISGQGRNEV